MSPEFLSPDVFVQEVQDNSGQIPTPSTSTFAMSGYSPRGPEGQALVLGSFKAFVDTFGGFSSKSKNAYAAAAFFQNGGSRLVFSRALHDDATYASGSFSGTWDVRSTGRGVWANDAEVTISGNPNFYDQATGEYSLFDISVELIDPNTGLLALVESFEAVDLVDDESPDYLPKVIDASSQNIVVTAVPGGIPAELQPVPYTGLSLGTGDGTTTAFAMSLSGQAPLAETTVKVKNNNVLIAEDDGNGELQAVSGGPAIGGTVDYETGALSITINPAPLLADALTVDVIKKPDASVTVTLLGGSDGSAVISSDVVSASLQPEGKGIYAFDAIGEQLQIGLPDFAGDVATDLALISYCANRADCLAIIQPPKGYSAQQAVNYRRNTLKSTSSYGCMYWPWINVPDSLNKNRPIAIPPVGHAAGRMAFTDQNDNVGKAPAGVNRGQLNYIISLEREITKTDRDLVYQAQINPIRSDSFVGTALWGNKTLQIVGDFVEINVRRLFIFLEKAQYAGLLDIVFENIGPFGIIKARLDAFLENLFLAGVIGSGVLDKNQAFKVICDESNNPPSVQQSKRIVIDEFIKPNLAAEFIHLRLQRVFDASQI